MDNKTLKDALRRRKGRKFAGEDFVESESKPGLESEDLKEKKTAVLGEGPKGDTLNRRRGADHSSTDELAPSREEMAERGVEGAREAMPEPFKNQRSEDFGEVGEETVISEVSGGYDDEVFDQREYDRARQKKNPSLRERMLLGLGNKMRR